MFPSGLELGPLRCRIQVNLRLGLFLLSKKGFIIKILLGLCVMTLTFKDEIEDKG